MEKCGHCGMIHDSVCPRIKAIDYYPDGTIKRVEYGVPPQMPLADWNSGVWNVWKYPPDGPGGLSG